MNHALIFAGGTGIRMNSIGKPKQFLELYGKPIIIYTIEVFDRHPEIDDIIIPCVAGCELYLESLINKYQISKVKKIVTGGNNTQESKMNALKYMRTYCKDDDIVLVHDAVRPLITEKLISDNILAVKEYGSAISVVPFTETGVISEDGGNSTKKTINRNVIYVAKAPQSFYFKELYEAHKKSEELPNIYAVDTCSLMTELGRELHLVPCEMSNIKITHPDDYFIFKALVDVRECNKNNETF